MFHSCPATNVIAARCSRFSGCTAVTEPGQGMHLAASATLSRCKAALPMGDSVRTGALVDAPYSQ